MVEERVEEVPTAEPWEPIESKLITWTVVAGILSMVVLFAAIYYTILVHYM